MVILSDDSRNVKHLNSTYTHIRSLFTVASTLKDKIFNHHSNNSLTIAYTENTKIIPEQRNMLWPVSGNDPKSSCLISRLLWWL